MTKIIAASIASISRKGVILKQFIIFWQFKSSKTIDDYRW